MRSALISRSLLPFLILKILSATASPPLICPGGAALGRFELTVIPPSGGAARNLQTVNRLLEGDTVSYRPLEIDSPAQKKARIAMLLVPSDGSKIVVFDPRPADEPTSWTIPFRAQLASLVWGPEGLDKSKVTDLVAKDDKLIAQLADYAAKTAETQALIEAITQQQTLATGESVDAAVAGFASQFPSAKLDRTQPADAQLGTLLHSVNPSLSTYDPLAQNPQQQVAQSAGLAAAVAGLFFGGSGVGLAVTGGAVLVDLHDIVFPHTRFLSALTQANPSDPAASDTSLATALCGSKAPPASHTEFAFLWAVRFPDVPAPALGLKTTAHLPIGLQSPIPLVAKDWSLVPRFEDWRLVSDDDAAANGPAAVPVSAKVNTTAKTIELDLAGGKSDKLKAGTWKLAANWDWDSVTASGNLVLHDLSAFKSAHLTPDSQDQLTSGAGTLDLQLTGDDFEFVHSIAYERQGDPFAQPETLPFHLPKEPAAGPETSLKVRLDDKSLAPGNYVFLVAQSDGKTHDVPFKVLQAQPSVSGTPIVLNTGLDSQTIVLHGTGLDRVQQISSDGAQFILAAGGDGAARTVTVKLNPGVQVGALLALQMKVKDFEQPVSLDDVFLVAGPKPQMTTVKQSVQGSLGAILNPGEMAANSLVSFEVGVLHAPAVSEIDLSCGNSPGSPLLKIKPGDAKPDLKFTQESPDTLFLSFRPAAVGPPGCAVTAALMTPNAGQSEPRKLGVIVLLPQIDSFEVTTEKAGDASWFAVLEGHDLEGITKVGWDAQTGTPVDSIPTPVASPGNGESLRVAITWPAPSPHAPLYVWLRGEDRGRLTTAKY